MSHLDHLATAIADEYICSCCKGAVRKHLGPAVIEEVQAQLTAHAAADKRKRYFDALYKSLEPWEERFATLLRRHWREEERIILANLKKLKKAWLVKDAADDMLDQIMFPEEEFERRIAEEMIALYTLAVADLGQLELDRLGLDIAFDVTNPNIASWIDDYGFYFAEKLEGASKEAIRRIIKEAVEEGYSVPKVTRMLRDQFEDWAKYRAERVARTEIIRSSNRANIESYRQAGIKYKVWMTSADCCDFCAPLEGKVVDIEEDFYSQGTTLEIEDVDGKVQRLYLDYEDVPAPPLHPNCRCAISPWFND